MKHALERHDRGLATVIPVILRPCDWQASPFSKLLARPRDGKPVTTWSNRDSALTDIAQSVRKVLVDRAGASPLGKDGSAEITERDEAALTVSLDGEGHQWKDVRFVIRNIGGCPFSALSVTFSIPESEHEQTDVFQSAGAGSLGPLDPGYAVEIPGPSNAMDFLWRRSLESSTEKRRFLDQVQIVVQAIESVSNVPRSWLFRFRFTELPTGDWACELDLERKINDLRRIIVARMDSATPQFGGDFFLEPKYE